LPELPEVEVVRAGLDPAVTGATVVGVSVFDERALTRHAGGSGAHFEAALTGRVLRGAARRGKFLWMPVEPSSSGSARPDEALVAHLGMSGQLLLRAPGASPEHHERVRLDLQHPVHGEIAVVFADQRTFGSLALDHDGDLNRALGELGVDERTVLLMAAAGFKGVEIAAATGKGAGATRNAMVEARLRLRRRLDAIGAER
jgi:formamidopyrimidine-DNA glycosylase